MSHAFCPWRFGPGLVAFSLLLCGAGVSHGQPAPAPSADEASRPAEIGDPEESSPACPDWVPSASCDPSAIFGGCDAVTGPQQPYVGPLATRSHFSGDWGGRRTALLEDGVRFDLYATQFYQGITSGGVARESEYGGKLDYLLNLDGGKMGLADGLLIDVHAETRFGTSVNQNAGQLSPPNVAMLFPEATGNTTAITGLKITQALSDDFVVYMGKINTLDEYLIRFSQQIGLERPGIGGFMNTSLVFNPILGRTVPYSALGFGAATLRDGLPFLSFTVFDPQERATTGIDDPFARGVVLVPTMYLYSEIEGKPGLFQIGASYSNSTYTSIDRSAYELVPQVGIVPGRESGSWSLYANFFQTLWVDPCDSKRGWGVFGQFGIADDNPSAIRYVANGGIAGRSMIPGRTLDTFGVGYFYLGLSDNFKGLFPVLLPQQDEHGVELFYNIAINPSTRLTFDLQVAQPSRQRLDTVVIPGARLAVRF